ncbi:MAG: zf-HC2 domain-containing protein [Acidobacteriales bacterium]|nr:zf-HC2 domain-containing protein [Terriglobales bacterium]
MEGLPKIAKGRLRQGPRPAAHPEAEALTAFVEQAMPSAERDRMLAHLAECAECREVVLLASPEAEAMQPVLALPAGRSWWNRVAVWQWGAAAAAVLVVASALVVMQPRVAPPEEMAALQRTAPASSAAPQVTEPAKADAKANLNANAAEVTKLEQPAAKDQRTRNEVASGRQSKKEADGVAGGTVGRVKREPPSDNVEITASAPMVMTAVQPAAPHSENAPLVTGQRTATTGEAGKLGGFAMSSGLAKPAAESARDQDAVVSAELKDAAAAPPPAPAKQEKLLLFKSKAKAAPADPTDAVAAKAFAVEESKKSEGMDFGLPAEGERVDSKSRGPVMPNAGSEWRIADDGHLQRLHLKPTPNWNTVKVGSEKLQILAFRGQEIWVGGHKGRLYKSVNNGMTWTRVKGPWGKDFTIVGLSFREGMNGELRLENGEVWVSQDGGGKWMKK